MPKLDEDGNKQGKHAGMHRQAPRENPHTAAIHNWHSTKAASGPASPSNKKGGGNMFSVGEPEWKKPKQDLSTLGVHEEMGNAAILLLADALNRQTSYYYTVR